MLDCFGVSDGVGVAIVTRADMAKSIGGARSFFEEKVKLQHLGVKTSKGIYDYGGRSELEILKKRDILLLKMIDYLKKSNAFEPV